MRVFEVWTLKRAFGAEGKEITGDHRKHHNKFYNL
jgi:hypothetical protein